ncbi:MAG: hypothetical protein K9I85_12960 [Saprospiraceae bacterium]|nr:hypothetical protein [Saprospiraceae bacterium]
MKWILITLLLIHGAIHLLGATKGFHWADISELTIPISRHSAIVWLVTALLFFSAATLLIRPMHIWWIPAMLAVILSVYLISTTWQDARWGMIPNIIILLISLVGFGQWRFDRQVAHAEQILIEAPHSGLKNQEKTTLPPIVQKWLERSSMPEESLQYVRVHQEGTMRLSPDGRWMPFTAKQIITPRNPGFVWSTKTTLIPGVFFLGQDHYKQGKGQMLIHVLGLIPIVNATGPEIDQGALLRYLGELVWLPNGALHPAIQWQEINKLTASATMDTGDISAAGTFTFSPSGDFLSYSAKRYFDRPDGPTLEDWLIEADPLSIRKMQGCQIPTRFRVIWKLAEGDFHWLDLKITDVEYFYAHTEPSEN